MTEQRSRRIVRRAVMTLAAVVLLPVWYVGSYLSLAFAYGAGWNGPHDQLVPVVYAPLRLYVAGEYPCSQSIDDASMWAYGKGFANREATRVPTAAGSTFK